MIYIFILMTFKSNCIYLYSFRYIVGLKIKNSSLYKIISINVNCQSGCVCVNKRAMVLIFSIYELTVYNNWKIYVLMGACVF